ncbi:hypothetical protein J6590_021063 [Homalodisca vitripennis]|nr:hypothetical protein J6590_021063 [Homalodisca vitripennis]
MLAKQLSSLVASSLVVVVDLCQQIRTIDRPINEFKQRCQVHDSRRDSPLSKESRLSKSDYKSYGRWIFGRLLCHLVAYAQGTSVYISTLTLTSIAIDRFFVIIYPFQPRMKLSTCLLIIAIIWVFSLLVTLPYGIYMTHNTLESTHYCEENWPSEKFRQLLAYNRHHLGVQSAGHSTLRYIHDAQHAREHTLLCLHIIAIIWVFSLLVTLPYGIYMTHNTLESTHYCEENWPSEKFRQLLAYNRHHLGVQSAGPLPYGIYMTHNTLESTHYCEEGLQKFRQLLAYNRHHLGVQSAGHSTLRYIHDAQHAREHTLLCLHIIAIIWVFSLLVTLPYGIYMTHNTLESTHYCEENWPSEKFRQVRV